MKRFLLLLSATIFLLHTESALALSDQCRRMLAMPAIGSHYTQRVIDRSQKGLEYARFSAANIDFSVYLPHWALSIASTWASIMESQETMTNSQQHLLSQSACLRFDAMMLECKMEEVRDEMNLQLKRGSFLAIIRLQSLLHFLEERYKMLEKGALDPTVTDSAWNRLYEFDDRSAIVCCTESDDAPVCEAMTANDCSERKGEMFFANPYTNNLCPFHSDYAPAFPDGYGCDAQTLQGSDTQLSRADLPAFRDEYDALVLVSQQVAAYKDSARKLLSIQQKIDALYGQTSTLPPPDPIRPHMTISNCNASGATIPLRALRGPFSIDTDHYQILTQFLNRRIDAGESRQFSDELKLPEEFAADQEAKKQRRALDDGTADGFLRSSLRKVFAMWSRIQGRSEGGSFAFIIDPALQTEEALVTLHAAVRDLATLAVDKDKGMRDFVLRFAWFLRRTCMNRPCSLNLEQIMKIALTNECFPYTNGEYLKDDVQSPRWKKCMEAAGIGLE